MRYFSQTAIDEKELKEKTALLRKIISLTYESFGEDVKLSRTFGGIIGVHPLQAEYIEEALFSLDLDFHNAFLFDISFARQARDFMIEYMNYLGLKLTQVNLEINLSDPAGHFRTLYNAFYPVKDLIQPEKDLIKFLTPNT